MDFGDEVRTLEHTWISLLDGTRLAARIWLPEQASKTDQVPAVLEYVPYRKNDLTAARDAEMHPYFAANGYASVRVDARGSGDSDGFLDDEYLAQEQADAVETIRWLAEQPWCTGKVGMIGKSWGGFTCLQVAAENPLQLSGIISFASTDDRYSDDVHYIGGAVNAWDQVTWASTVTALAALPPGSSHRPDWHEAWKSRLEHVEPMLHEWMAHQTRDSYWKHGSVIENYDAIKCPVFMVGGWNDAYRDSVFRVLEGYPGLSKGLIGPWAHTYPHQGAPGPAIDFLGLAVRWWDHCLKGIDNGIQREPKMQAWMQTALRSDAGYDDRSGQWAAYTEWPQEQHANIQFFLQANDRLAGTPGDGQTLTHRSSLVPPTNRGNWCPGGWAVESYDLPGDQQTEDAKSLTFTSDALETPVSFLGIPELTLTVASDRPVATLAVRLLDVHPDGTSTLVSRGFLNLTHRESHESPKPLQPGVEYTVVIPLQSNGYDFEAEHQIRVALDSTYWPWIWPSPELPILSVKAADSSFLSLPLTPDNQSHPVDLGTGRSAPPLLTETVGPTVPATRSMEFDEATGVSRIIDTVAEQLTRIPETGLIYGASGQTIFSVQEGKPLSARIECRRGFSFSEDERPAPTAVEVHTTMSCTSTDFIITTRLEAHEANQVIFERNWSRTLPRTDL
ncbi:CocE/NonD family hydrolase [Arthrobacter sp. R4]|uniref:CocE/NonD family hydrolase n=1 Tax=Arthrobacter sp. R4 TaxID=644417 RepID=UPI003EDAEB78